MLDFQKIAAAILVAFRDNGPIADASDRRPGRGGVIHAVMCPVAFQDRMETGVGEAGGDPEEIEWRLQERFPQAVALLVEKLLDAVLREGDRVIVLALVREDGRFDRSDAEACRVVDVGLVIDHLKSVALLNVEEVDLPGVNIRDANRQERIVAIGLDDIPERRVDSSFGIFLFQSDGLGVFVGADCVAGQVDDGIVGHRLGKGDVFDAGQAVERRERVVVHAGPQLGRVEHVGRGLADAVRLQGREAQVREDQRWIVASLDQVFLDIERVDTDAILGVSISMSSVCFLEGEQPLIQRRPAMAQINGTDLRIVLFVIDYLLITRECTG